MILDDEEIIRMLNIVAAGNRDEVGARLNQLLNELTS